MPLTHLLQVGSWLLSSFLFFLRPSLHEAQLLRGGELQFGNDGLQLVDHVLVGGLVAGLVANALEHADGAGERRHRRNDQSGLLHNKK